MYSYPIFPSYNRQDIIRVNGRAGAETFQMMPNSSVLLLDETAPIVWLAQTDGAGYKTLSPYSITPYEPEKPVDVNELVARIERLERTVSNESDYTKSEQAEFITSKADDGHGAKSRKSSGNVNADGK